jgi:hypothetical protein
MQDNPVKLAFQKPQNKALKLSYISNNSNIIITRYTLVQQYYYMVGFNPQQIQQHHHQIQHHLRWNYSERPPANLFVNLRLRYTHSSVMFSHQSTRVLLPVSLVKTVEHQLTACVSS